MSDVTAYQCRKLENPWLSYREMLDYALEGTRCVECGSLVLPYEPAWHFMGEWEEGDYEFGWQHHECWTFARWMRRSLGMCPMFWGLDNDVECSGSVLLQLKWNALKARVKRRVEKGYGPWIASQFFGFSEWVEGGVPLEFGCERERPMKEDTAPEKKPLPECDATEVLLDDDCAVPIKPNKSFVVDIPYVKGGKGGAEVNDAWSVYGGLVSSLRSHKRTGPTDVDTAQMEGDIKSLTPLMERPDLSWLIATTKHSFCLQATEEGTCATVQVRYSARNTELWLIAGTSVTVEAATDLPGQFARFFESPHRARPNGGDPDLAVTRVEEAVADCRASVIESLRDPRPARWVRAYRLACATMQWLALAPEKNARRIIEVAVLAKNAAIELGWLDNAHGGQKGAAHGDGAAGLEPMSQMSTRPAPVDEEDGA